MSAADGTRGAGGPRRHRVVLDTDLGSDVDDAQTLALLLGSPEVDLLGVTTVYGDTDLRARETSAMLALAGAPVPPDLPVLAGAPQPLSGAEVWWAGHEGTLAGDLRAAATTPVEASTDAADWLAAQVAADPGGVDVLAVGPLTNVALAISRSPSFARDVRRIWVMGGRWDGARDASGALEPEHNLRSDVDAARVVLTCGAPTTVVGLEVTERVRTPLADLLAIEAAGDLGAVLGAQMRQWWAYWDEPDGVPHDPVTALALVAPGLVPTGPAGAVVVEDTGAVRHAASAGGSVTLAVGVDVDAARAEVVRRVVAGCTRGRPATAR